MFTGIVETIGLVKTVRGGAGQMALSIDLGKAAEGVKAGESMAVNGVCLTVSRLVSGRVAEFDVSSETLAVSAMDRIRAGSKVNLEHRLG